MSFTKKYYDKYGKYNIYLVNEEAVRNSSYELEEFTNYAIHSDFKKIIKSNEIYLSDRVNDTEKIILINEALQRIKYELSGMSEKKAYNKALKYDQNMRHKISNTNYSTDTKNIKIDKKVYIKKYGTFDDIVVWIVNGEIIRNLYRPDYIEGGHDIVYNWIPHNEIFIDCEVPDDERIFIMIHELVERKLMACNHMIYDKAHTLAAKVEWQFRVL